MFKGLIPILLLSLNGCTTVVSSITSDLADDLSAAILDNPDVKMVEEGAPAYLILMDGLLGESSENVRLLMQTSALNSAYAAAFVDDEVRSQHLHTKALKLSERAVCLEIKNGCNVRQRPYDEYEVWVSGLGERQVEVVYNFGSAWAGWMQANADDYLAIAELGKLKLLMQRIAEIDENHDQGGVQLYLGVFETLVPPSLGGQPEVGRAHFERAIEIGQGQFLMSKVLFAQQYARLVFDRDLHDQLLEEVLATDPQTPGGTLTNTVAQKRAKELLESADEYF